MLPTNAGGDRTIRITAGFILTADGATIRVRTQGRIKIVGRAGIAGVGGLADLVLVIVVIDAHGPSWISRSQTGGRPAPVPHVDSATLARAGATATAGVVGRATVAVIHHRVVLFTVVRIATGLQVIFAVIQTTAVTVRITDTGGIVLATAVIERLDFDCCQ